MMDDRDFLESKDSYELRDLARQLVRTLTEKAARESSEHDAAVYEDRLFKLVEDWEIYATRPPEVNVGGAYRRCANELRAAIEELFAEFRR